MMKSANFDQSRWADQKFSQDYRDEAKGRKQMLINF